MAIVWPPLLPTFCLVNTSKTQKLGLLEKCLFEIWEQQGERNVLAVGGSECLQLWFRGVMVNELIDYKCRDT